MFLPLCAVKCPSNLEKDRFVEVLKIVSAENERKELIGYCVGIHRFKNRPRPCPSCSKIKFLSTTDDLLILNSYVLKAVCRVGLCLLS